MEKKKKKKKEYDGLWMPNAILNIYGLDAGCKMLLAHFYNFGTKGCYQSNKTLAEIFMTSECTISRRIKKLSEYILIKNPKGYYRTVWVKIHPQVNESIKIYNKEKNKSNRISGQNESASLRLNCLSQFSKSSQSSMAKSVVSLRQNCLTTNKEINKETSKERAADLPMPAGGQASRLLEERKPAAAAKIEQFKKRFGIGQRKERMSPQEFESRRRMIIKQLRNG